MKKIIILTLLCASVFVACMDLDIPPRNVVGDEALLTNSSGMEIYLARMYSIMPLEDFKYLGEWGFNGSGWLNAIGIDGTGESVNRDGISKAFTGENAAYWNSSETGAQPFALLRDANYLIETLPSYKGSHATVDYDNYMGEAYFTRALVFYTMAKRFGGIPLVTKVIAYPAEKSKLEVPRSSEEQTWDQILADFDLAISLLSPSNETTGRINKFVALTYKSEAMLYAGCVAKYNETVIGRLTGIGQKTGVRVMGFDANTWSAASKKYFKESYLAARQVMTDGKYSLYKTKWSATDRQAQYQNMVDMFSDLSSPENIFVKQYIYPTSTHAYDAYSAPFTERSPLSSGVCVTLDFVELFDGFERYPNGTIKVTTGSSNTTGSYLLFNEPMDFFKDAEPRLRAYVIFPDDMFKGKKTDIRAGTYVGTTPIAPLFSDYSYAAANIQYQHSTAYNNKTLLLSPKSETQVLVDYNGKKMTASGANGPFFDQGESAITGLYGRKWLNPNPSYLAVEGNSAQPFVLMRYADVLLNAAEAAIELLLAGESSPDASDLSQVATQAVNDIRERAGATLLVGNILGTEIGRDIVRKERRKELAFENKTKWDLRRWRVQHYDGRDGFWGEKRDADTYSNNSRYRFRGLHPFFATATGQYFFDAHFQTVSMKTFEYNPIDYYFSIPGGEVSKSLVIDQQPNR